MFPYQHHLKCIFLRCLRFQHGLSVGLRTRPRVWGFCSPKEERRVIAISVIAKAVRALPLRSQAQRAGTVAPVARTAQGLFAAALERVLLVTPRHPPFQSSICKLWERGDGKLIS